MSSKNSEEIPIEEFHRRAQIACRRVDREMNAIELFNHIADSILPPLGPIPKGYIPERKPAYAYEAGFGDEEEPDRNTRRNIIKYLIDVYRGFNDSIPNCSIILCSEKIENSENRKYKLIIDKND